MKEISDPYWTLIFEVLTTTYGTTVNCANISLAKKAISTNMFKSSIKDYYSVAMFVTINQHLMLLSLPTKSQNMKELDINVIHVILKQQQSLISHATKCCMRDSYMIAINLVSLNLQMRVKVHL